ncbi:GNAT family N-acetyltransferase [Microlunatus soli]|uniref:Acetyltransferase (GNAT) family protein n=1 Tax=Microlunatus soli TaxID=630515 RepID=A0A1H2A0N3_9ACTN|nr:GNAT family N-acetyltransferase [Microlunatus soli]SDT39500.1 Acetyltransferase (GNAT) family protein [Microlunatus soli]
MPKSTLIGDLADLVLLAPPNADQPIDYVLLDRDHREDVADLYLASYPPHVGAADLNDALAEMDSTYAGDFGTLIPEASLLALRGGRAAGSIQVVHRSPWDADLDCPFIIELFVHPAARDHGLGRSLLTRAAVACQRLGETQIALRTSDEGGTSPAAFHLYQLAGMRPYRKSVQSSGSDGSTVGRGADRAGIPSSADPLITIERRRDPRATEEILRALPDWFGIEDAILGYVEDARSKTSYLAIDDGRTVGVALLESHFPQSVELHLIAVHPNYRRQGIGKQLLAQIEDDLREQSVSLFQVKTVGASFDHAGYAETRAFYRSRGFLALEEMNGISWDGPTVIMVKPLRS